MNITITKRCTRDKSKIYYTLEWGKKAGQRMATGIFTYVHPANTMQEDYNKEAQNNLETKRAQLILEWQAIGTGRIPAHKYQSNFLDFYKDYVLRNRQYDNRHLECSYARFRKFINGGLLLVCDVTEELATRFRKYLLSHLNGETPANYFARFKRVVRAATKQGYFINNPTQDLSSIANKNKKRKNNLEVEEYIQLLKTPSLNEEVKDAFIFCCYTGLRWCDVSSLHWRQINSDSISISLFQEKTGVEHYISLHPIAKAILNKKRNRSSYSGKIFFLPTADGANKVLGSWCKNAGIEKHITWSCARLSFSILLQDRRVDVATVALILGHTSCKYVDAIYKRFRPKNQLKYICRLPSL